MPALPNRPSADLQQPVRLRLAAALPVPSFDLTRETLALPKIPTSWTTRVQPWPTDWLRFDLDRLPLKAITLEALDHSSTWMELLAKPEAAQGLELCLYTDGSASTKPPRSGYAVTILLKLGLCFAVFGIIGDQLIGASEELWPLDAPAALRSEQVAVAVALMWILQFRALMPALTCTVSFDCMAAGYATMGKWQAPDEFGERIHLLEMYLREQPGLQLHFEHVKAHHSCPWNELSDVVAKEAAEGRLTAGAPPLQICKEFLQTDFSWLAAEARAARTKDINIHCGCLEWGAAVDDGFRLRPEQLIPVQNSCSSPADRPLHYELKIGTLNVQGFGDKAAYLDAQLHAEAYNVVMFQETKSPLGLVRSRCYLRLHSASLARWGVAIWIHRKLGLYSLNGTPGLIDEHDLEVLHEDPRLLLLKVRPAALSIYLIAAHCPHVLKGAETSEFLDRLERKLQCTKGADLVLCGIDLNGRVPGPCDDVTGGAECSEPDTIGKRFVSILASCRLWLPSTYRHLHPGEDCTFVHHSGSEHRIDYIAVGGRAACLQAHSQVCMDFDTGAPREDHRLVGLRLRGTFSGISPRPTLWRPAFDRAKIVSEEGRSILREACRAFPSPGWEVSPDDHCQRIQDMLISTLTKHFMVEQPMARSAFIPDEVWSLREAKLRLKRLSRGRLKLWSDLVVWAFRQWRTDRDDGLCLLVQKQGLLYQLAAAAVRFATNRVRRGVAAGRQKFVADIVAEGNKSAAQLLRSVKAAGIGGARTKNSRRPLPALLDPCSGQPVGSKAERDQVWLEYFGQQEQGEILDTPMLLARAATPMQTDEVEWKLEHLPSVAEIQKILRSTPRLKAGGLDNVPGDVLVAAHGELADILHPLFLKSMVWSRQLVQWRGGILFEAFKNAGSNQDVSSFRSLFISSAIGKSFHRLVRNKIQQHTQRILHPLHCGPRQHAPVLFPELYILSHVRRCISSGLCYAILFLDTKSAYYAISRELAVGDICRDDTVVNLFKKFHLGPEDLQELMATVAAGGVMAEAGVPPALRQVIRDLHYGTWFTTRFSDGKRTCQTYAGSRPGESFADTVFGFIYAKLLCSIYECAAAEELAFVLPGDPEAGIYGDGVSGVDQTSWDGTWADDSAFPTVANDPDEIIRKATRLAEIVLGSCQAVGLTPNMKVGKTSLLLRLCGKGTKKARQRHFGDGSPMIRVAALGMAVPVVPQYRHLGGFLDVNNTHMVEARHRIALATKAYDDAGKLLLGRKDIPLEVRAGAFNMVVTPSLFNIGAWIPMGRAWDVLNNAYSRLVRRLLSPLSRGDKLFRIPLPVVHIATGCWKLALVARRARLSLLVSLVKAGPDLLWAALQAEKRWLRCVRDDLAWLVAGDVEDWPRLDAAGWPAWFALIRAHPDRFKRRVARRLKTMHQNTSEADMVSVCLWAMHRALPPCQRAPGCVPLWKCWTCDVSFDTKAKLSVHFFKRHKRVAEYRHFTEGSFCKACGTEFWSEGRLAAHLRFSAKCVASLRQSGPALEVVVPGFGSRRRRQTDVEQFTPAIPMRASSGGQRRVSFIGNYVMPPSTLLRAMISVRRSGMQSRDSLCTRRRLPRSLSTLRMRSGWCMPVASRASGARCQLMPCRGLAVMLLWKSGALRTMRPSSLRRPRLLRSSEATSTPLTGMKRSGE